jgi:hypothetical protein
MQAGWDIDLAAQLERSAPFGNLKIDRFGRNINMIRLALGSQGPVVE